MRSTSGDGEGMLEEHQRDERRIALSGTVVKLSIAAIPVPGLAQPLRHYARRLRAWRLGVRVVLPKTALYHVFDGLLNHCRFEALSNCANWDISMS